MSRARNRNGQSSMMRGDLMEIDENGCFSNVPPPRHETRPPRREQGNLAIALEYLQDLMVKKSLSIKFRHEWIDNVHCIITPEVVLMYGPDEKFIGSRQPTEQEKRQLK